MAYQIITQLFAEREIRLVRHPLGTPAKKEVRLEEEYSTLPTETATHAPQYGAGGSVPSTIENRDRSDFNPTQEFVQRSDSGLRNRVYRRSAREKLRRAGVACEYLFPGLKDWWFLTLTFPTESIEGCNAIADNSGVIVKRLKNFLRKYEQSEATYLYCWERQKRGTLHLHYGCHLPGSCDRGFSEAAFHRWGVGVVDWLSVESGVNIWLGRWGRDWSSKKSVLQATAQKVRKGIARYISKYVSKEAGKNSERWNALSSPLRWVGLSRNISDKIKSLTIVKRRFYASYLSARNAFAEAVDKLRLGHPSGLCYHNCLTDCEGETFSMFKEFPCQRLLGFIMQSKTRLDSYLSATKATTLDCQSELLDFQKTVAEWFSAVEEVTKEKHSTESFAEFWQQERNLASSGVLNLRGTYTRVVNRLRDIQGSVSRSRFAGRSAAMKRVSNSWQGLQWVMHRWRQNPILMITTLNAWAAQCSESEPTEQVVQGTLF